MRSYEKITDLYERQTRYDELQGESNSIINVSDLCGYDTGEKLLEILLTNIVK